MLYSLRVNVCIYSAVICASVTPLPVFLQFNRTGRGSVCSQAIMLVTDGATQMYDDVFQKYNWPERKVCLSLSSKPSVFQVFEPCTVRLCVKANTVPLGDF